MALRVNKIGRSLSRREAKTLGRIRIMPRRGQVPVGRTPAVRTLAGRTLWVNTPKGQLRRSGRGL